MTVVVERRRGRSLRCWLFGHRDRTIRVFERAGTWLFDARCKQCDCVVERPWVGLWPEVDEQR